MRAATLIPVAVGTYRLLAHCTFCLSDPGGLLLSFQGCLCKRKMSLTIAKKHDQQVNATEIPHAMHHSVCHLEDADR